jgi:hypothetical protein
MHAAPAKAKTAQRYRTSWSERSDRINKKSANQQKQEQSNKRHPVKARSTTTVQYSLILVSLLILVVFIYNVIRNCKRTIS